MYTYFFVNFSNALFQFVILMHVFASVQGAFIFYVSQISNSLFDSFKKMFERLANSFSLEKINISSFKESKLFLVLFIVLMS